ncbi:MAG: hypothetical protein ACR2IV_04990 [Bryobacteraceae bacterium]
MIGRVEAGLLVFCMVTVPQALAPRVTGLDSEQQLIKEVAESGRCADLPQDPDARVSPLRMVAPGPPPLLSFRYYEGKLHHAINNTDLMLDDAGH